MTTATADQAPCLIRRQVSDLGMEDPVTMSSKKAEEEETAKGVANLSEDEEAEMDIDDLMSMSTRSSRASSLGGGSLALKAMSDSFNNTSFNSCSSTTNDDSEEFTISPAESPTGRRKLPARSGSGYCRDGRSSSSASDRRKYVRSGVAVSAAALREKRRSSNLNSSMSQVAISSVRGPQ